MTDDIASTAAVLPILSVLPSGHQLMAAGMLKRNFKKLFQKHHNNPKIVKALQDMLKSPELFVQAMDGKLTKASTPRDMNNAFAGALRAIANEATDNDQ